ncbi:TetR/AcrR family transcriptional regulator [Paenibacillus harenae]|uniref:AcrR family transcriptional regulator n=1 Tax=Paenibacillus harenae TaxID=306543 RepID=A0ABT9UB32_PAEHA|nr:TetR-like C-terminal domain-containing protein [Paenibacillus harenae]MDQ0116216.1 AcrR family transcriptional regulator [Paenibacillus harenae]
MNLITNKAGINRVTFYLHYKDLDDMLESMVNDMINEIEAILLEDESKSNRSDYVLTTLIRLLEYIASHAKVYKVLLVSKKIPVFTPKFIELMVKLILQNIDSHHHTHLTDKSTVSNVPKEITAWYGASALVGTVALWLGNDMPYSPHYLAAQIIKFNL